MSALVTYYTLINEAKLPLNSKVIDPYDNKAYSPIKGETLKSFSDRINSARIKNSYPTIPFNELTDFVTASLYTNANNREKDAYFTRKAMSPAFGQLKSLALSVARELSVTAQVPVIKKDKRASMCLTCPLHQTSKRGSSIVDNLPIHSLRKATASKHESSLGVCGMCGCGLKAKIRYNIRSIFASLTPEMLDYAIRLIGPGFFSSCWMVQEVEQEPDLNTILEKKIANIHSSQAKDFYKAHLAIKAQAKLQKPKQAKTTLNQP